MYEWIPIIVVVTVSVIVFMMLVLSGERTGVDPLPSIVVWSISLILLWYAGYRIWQHTESIGRRIAFIMLAAVLVIAVLPISNALRAVFTAIGIVIALFLVVAMIPKDFITVICLIPVLALLCYGFFMSFRMAKYH